MHTRLPIVISMAEREHRLAAILFTDIVGFSRMMEHDEPGTLELLSTNNSLVRNTVAAHRGRVIKTIGDAIMCEFSNSVDAVKCAIEIQEGVGVHNEAEPRLPLRMRIGVHLGDIYFTEDDAVGDGINVVTRLQSVAKPGRIALSGDVYRLASNKIGADARPLGQVKLRDLSREIEAYEIAVSEAAEVSAPWDPAPSEADRPQTPPVSESTGSSSDSARTAQYESSDVDEIKALVLQEIKRAGRRISIGEMREKLPDRSARVDAALESLVTKGFLTSSTSTSSSRSVSSSGASSPGWGPGPSPTGAVSSRQPGPPRRPSSSRSAGSPSDWSGKDQWSKHAYQSDDDEQQQIQTGWDRALAEPVPEGAYDSLVEDYKDHAANVAEKEKSGFRSHLMSYLGVNAGLFGLWMFTGGGFPWFAIPLLAWGIGMASHYIGVRGRVQESKELDQSEGLTREQLRLYRRLVKNRNSWRGHLVSNAATSVFLLALNLITFPGFMWALIPIGGMAIGVLSHLPVFKARERRLLKRLREIGARIGGILGGKGSVDRSEEGRRALPLTGPAAEAEQIRSRVLSAIQAMPDESPLGADFEPLLENYVDQIKLLDQKNRELSAIMDGIPVADLERDLLLLQKKRQEEDSEKVAAEYDRSIIQIQKQQTSFGELRNEQEILRLRLSSSLNQLKQLEIDLARMRSMSSGGEESASLTLLRDKSRELSQYLDDLTAGYDELG